MEYDLVISSQLIHLPKVRSFLKEVFVSFNIDNQHFNRIFIGISEAVVNSIVHGNGSDDSKYVHIKVSFSNNILSIEIKDEGKGFQFNTLKDPTNSDNIKKENGRGIFLIKNTADNYRFEDGGSKIIIHYNFN